MNKPFLLVTFCFSLLLLSSGAYAFSLDLGYGSSNLYLGSGAITYEASSGGDIEFQREVISTAAGTVGHIEFVFGWLGFEYAQYNYSYDLKILTDSNFSSSVTRTGKTTITHQGVNLRTRGILGGLFIGMGSSEGSEVVTASSTDYTATSTQSYTKIGAEVFLGGWGVRGTRTYTTLGGHDVITSSLGVVYSF